MRRYVWLLLQLIASAGIATAQRSSLKSLLVGGSLPARYLTQVASFGSQMNETLNFNLMLPPDNPWLCEYPTVFDEMDQNTTDEIQSDEMSLYPTPVALFVSINSCSAEQKAKIAVEIQQRLISRLQLLVIYSPDPRSNSLLTLGPDNENNTDSYNSIGIVHIPYRYAAGIETRMRMAWTGSDPRFLLGDNEEWSFPIQISNYTNTGDDDDFRGPYSRSSSKGGSNSKNIYWFRIILFSLLVLSPCCRAGYLWYSGGGRFYFRRNDRGWIVGLQYVPPSPAWLTAGRMVGGGGPPESQRASTITDEQFATLPEIEYQPIASHYDEDNEETNNGETKNEDTTEGDVVVLKEGEYDDNNNEKGGKADSKEEEAEEEEEEKEQQAENAANETKKQDPPSDDDDGDVDAADAMERGENPPDAPLTCRSTMCSVCIDDFEEGEKIILLPRCQHGFHRDCIHPWLTERQGCCPFCKTSVFGEPAATTEASEASPDSEAAESPAAVEEEVDTTQDPEAPPPSEALPADEPSQDIGNAPPPEASRGSNQQ